MVQKQYLSICPKCGHRQFFDDVMTTTENEHHYGIVLTDCHKCGETYTGKVLYNVIPSLN